VLLGEDNFDVHPLLANDTALLADAAAAEALIQ
jgi:hypothetical protein